MAIGQTTSLSHSENTGAASRCRSNPAMTDGDVDDVVAAVRDFLTSWER
jgi:hypothetical protein